MWRERNRRERQQFSVAFAPAYPAGGRPWLRVAWEPAAGDARPTPAMRQRVGAVLRACLQASVEAEPALHGELVVAVVLRADGAVASVTPVSLAGSVPVVLVACARGRLRQARGPVGTDGRTARIILRFGGANVAPRARIRGEPRPFAPPAPSPPAPPPAPPPPPLAPAPH